ncbi:helix-turn-helix domain-containing protein [Streptomyces smyrnaeus]|uniref:helix-turn-helix domain-containing protein n=1 Tax=Streptomyces TaxID=1883 RepID=UPI000C1A7312|nr:helix-turn-helix transcriptional regulator [Streptomyces sp. B15]MBQ1124094.1 helix-turn-helix domain-containing protein [Streptomyces sp. B15]
MGRWRPLPQDVRPEVRRLVERLRLLKDRSGLSYTALAAKTPYSASSWQRYLSAVTLPPWEAVEALAKLSGTERRLLVRLSVQWESANEAWEEANRRRARTKPVPTAPAAPAAPGVAATSAGTAATGVSGGAGPNTAAVPGWRAPGGPGARSVAVRAARWSVALASLVLLACVPDASGRGIGRPAWPFPLPSEAAGPAADEVRPRCRGEACEGRDPVRAGCQADGRVVGRYDIRNHRIEVYRSIRCAAVWGAVTPANDVKGISLSAPGAGQLWEDSQDGRTAMAPAPENLGSNVQVCAVIADRHSCVDAGKRAWTD